MINILSLIKKEFLSTLGNPKERLVIILPAIIQLLVFSKVATMDVKNIHIGVINRDVGHYGSRVVEGLRGSGKTFTSISFLKNKNEAIKSLNSGKISGYIDIPYDFSLNVERKSNISILNVFNGSKLNSASISSVYLSSIIANSLHDKIYAHGTVTPNVNIRYWFNPALEFLLNMLPTLLISITGMSALNIAGMSIAKEKELGTLNQLLISPATSNQIIFSKLLNTLIIAMIQGILSFLLIVYFFGLKFQGALFLIFLTVFLVVLVMGSIGLCISAISTTQQQSTINSLFVTIPLMNTAGFAAPFENMPLILQKISYLFNPLAHGVMMCRGIFLKNINFLTTIPNIVQLILILITSLIVSIYFFQKRLG